MKNVLISSIFIIFSFCIAQKEKIHHGKYIITLENKKCSDQVILKNNLFHNKLLLIWDGKDCDKTIRSYIKNVDYRKDTIIVNIWMENIDELKVKIVEKNRKLYISELSNKTHYFDEDKQCRYNLNYLLPRKTNLSPIIYRWLNENKCN